MVLRDGETGVTEDDLDGLDIQILQALQQDSQRTAAELSQIVPLSPSAILRRIQRYRAEGLIAADVSVLDFRRLRERISVLVFIQLERHAPDVLNGLRAHLARSPVVQFAAEVSGAYDICCMLVFSSMEAFNEFVEREIAANPAVRRYETSFIKRRIKFSAAVPLAPASPQAKAQAC